MKEEANITVSDEISKTSAVASWSGFIYQGKVALYQAIKLLTESSSSSSYELKVEHLDDFAIFKDDTALFIHQVKSTQSKYRSSYKAALNQAADVISFQITELTQRFFHVSVNLDDFSEHEYNGKVVKFFKYHNSESFVPPNGMDFMLKEMIAKYLDKYSLCHSPELIQYKLDTLNSLISTRVNFAHALNQKSSLNQYEATDTTPIIFSEIVECLKSEVLAFDDKKYLLFRFKKQFIQVIDEFADFYEEDGESEAELVHLSLCKKAIANLDNTLLERLYLSLDPSNFFVKGEIGLGIIHRYLNIINRLPSFITKNSLPYYINAKNHKYIPSSIGLDGMSKKILLNKLDEHISELRSNTALLNILFEFDNLVVEIKESEFKLTEFSKPKATHNGVCKDDVNNSEFIALQNNIIKAKRIRFVSVETAVGEIN